MDTTSPNELPVRAVGDFLALLQGSRDSEDRDLSEGIELFSCDIWPGGVRGSRVLAAWG